MLEDKVCKGETLENMNTWYVLSGFGFQIIGSLIPGFSHFKKICQLQM